MPSRYTLASAGLMAGVTVSQVVVGDYLAAGAILAALGTGAVGYSQDRTTLGKLLGRLQR